MNEAFHTNFYRIYFFYSKKEVIMAAGELSRREMAGKKALQ
jgi:hypothetical protein